MKKIHLIIISALLIAACNKAKEDVTSPEIIILSPEKNASHSLGDSVEVKVQISDEDLHNIYIKLEGDSYCCSAIDLKTHSHDLTYNYQRKVLLPQKDRYRLWVKATDHNDNVTEIADYYFTVE